MGTQKKNRPSSAAENPIFSTTTSPKKFMGAPAPTRPPRRPWVSCALSALPFVMGSCALWGGYREVALKIRGHTYPHSSLAPSPPSKSFRKPLGFFLGTPIWFSAVLGGRKSDFLYNNFPTKFSGGIPPRDVTGLAAPFGWGVASPLGGSCALRGEQVGGSWGVSCAL